MSGILNALTEVGVAKEVTWGTGVAPTTYLPVSSISADPIIKTVVDEAIRGHMTKDYLVIRTNKHAEVSIDTNFYTNPLGFFFLSLFGADTVTGLNPYTHTFKINSAPPPLTVQDYDGEQERRYAGAVVQELSVKGDAEGLVTVSVKLISKFGTDIANTTATILLDNPLTGYGSAITIGAVANAKLFGWEFTFKREVKPIFATNNSQDPTKIVRGRFECTGKLTFDVDDGTEFDSYTTGTEVALVLTLNGTASNNAKITLTKAHIEKASFDRGGENLRVDWEVRGLYNATDGGPCQFELTNTTAAY